MAKTRGRTAWTLIQETIAHQVYVRKLGELLLVINTANTYWALSRAHGAKNLTRVIFCHQHNTL